MSNQIYREKMQYLTIMTADVFIHRFKLKLLNTNRIFGLHLPLAQNLTHLLQLSFILVKVSLSFVQKSHFEIGKIEISRAPALYTVELSRDTGTRTRKALVHA